LGHGCQSSPHNPVTPNFWTVKDDAMMRLNEITQFQKDLALLGAALVFFAVIAYGSGFGPSVTDPLFDL
jgi:hypothetical protein